MEKETMDEPIESKYILHCHSEEPFDGAHIPDQVPTHQKGTG